MMDDSEVLAGLSFLERHAPPEFGPALRMAAGACLQIHAQRIAEALRGRSAEELELSGPTLSALGHLGLKTVKDVEDFVGLPEHVILERGKKVWFGKKSIKEVRDLLKQIGLEARR